MKFTNWKPLMAFGMIFVLGVFIGAIIILAIMPNYFNVLGSGMGRIMVFASFGVVLMVVIMFLFFRKMIGHDRLRSGMTQQQQTINSNYKDHNMVTLSLEIPAISCVHCKMTIEQKLSELSGVASVNVNVASQQAVVHFDSPATKAEIIENLNKIGYPPNVQ